MTCNVAGLRAFDTNFLRVLFATSPSQWVQSGINIFDFNLLLMPFDANGHKSLFVVIGAKNIRSYTHKGFKGSRPCILHFDSTNCSPSRHHTSRGRHDHNVVADKLRTWMNRIWRRQHDDVDHLLMPFNKRSMPILTPYGT